MPELTTVELVSGFVGLTVVLCFLKLTIAEIPTPTESTNNNRVTIRCAGQLNENIGHNLLKVIIKITAISTCTTGIIFNSMIFLNVNIFY
jgi:hypothetical protein